MAMSNAERQQRWRDKRKRLVWEAERARAAAREPMDPALRKKIEAQAFSYRKHAFAHTTHDAAATRDTYRAGRTLLELKKLIKAANMDWWEFYKLNFDKPRRWAERAMRWVEEDS